MDERSESFFSSDARNAGSLAVAVFQVAEMSSLSVLLGVPKAASVADFGVAVWRRDDGAMAQWIAYCRAGEAGT